MICAAVSIIALGLLALCAYVGYRQDRAERPEHFGCERFFKEKK